MPSDTTQQEEPLITLTLSQLRAFKFGDERLESVSIRSKTTGDTAKVYVIPLVLGQYLAELDKGEDYFHVELFDSSHAELWLSFEWKESNARRSRFCAQMDAERKSLAKRRKRIAEIKAAFVTNFPDSQADYLAQVFLDNLAKRHEYTAVVSALQILNLLDRYDKEDKEENQGS